MIKTPINKILFLDIETVGCCPDYDSCETFNPNLASLFSDYFDWFLKRFPEDSIQNGNLSQQEQMNIIFKKRAPLVPEFAKIVCVVCAFVAPDGEIKKQTIANKEEKILLKEVQDLLNKCGKLDFYLCGHNLKNFDIPMLAKRMMINGILPPSILPAYDTKPWDIKAIDTKEIWQYGSYTSIGSLDLLCTCLEIESPKNGEVKGENVHKSYWEEDRLKEISEYCEKDVIVLVDIIKKLKSLN
jgi:predicted PolB exonuclease-like 3'-5' exonuclease